ncbi:MAG TPA: protein phosphatase 2C domain-containing protein [Chloroflexota bacterium]|jgi:hypothetical protein|nr:protein phosphatase 2C domain-containing protein [Chloroflexota bacterium]
MLVRLTTAAIQKQGNAPDEYEDAYWPSCPLSAEAWYIRAAVADGATEASFSREWAGELVEAYGRGRLVESRLAETMPRSQRRWRAQTERRSLPWYAEEKLRSGAFSSILGFSAHDHSGGDVAGLNTERGWKAFAVGDTCLALVRGGRVVSFFPLGRSEDFSSTPALVSSIGTANGELHRLTRRARGSWRSGDRFLLMTDALACWFLRSVENGRDFSSVLSAATTDGPAVFESWISERRRSGDIRNDDVTLMIIDLLANA